MVAAFGTAEYVAERKREARKARQRQRRAERRPVDFCEMTREHEFAVADPDSPHCNICIVVWNTDGRAAAWAEVQAFLEHVQRIGFVPMDVEAKGGAA